MLYYPPPLSPLPARGRTADLDFDFAQLELRYSMPQLQIPVELVILHLAMLAFLEKYQVSVSVIVQACVCSSIYLIQVAPKLIPFSSSSPLLISPYVSRIVSGKCNTRGSWRRAGVWASAA